MSQIRLLESLSFPFFDDRWWRKLFLGWLLSAVPILNFVATGYVMRIYRNRIFNIEEVLPEWDEWASYFKEGLLVNLIVMIYVLLPSWILSIVFPSLPALKGAIVIVISFMVPMAIGYFIVYRTFRSGFAIKEILEKIKIVFSDYILMFMLLLGFGFILMFFIQQLQLRKDFFSYILFAGIQFYFQIVIMKMFGDLYPVDQKDWSQVEIVNSPFDDNDE